MSRKKDDLEDKGAEMMYQPTLFYEQENVENNKGVDPPDGVPGPAARVSFDERNSFDEMNTLGHLDTKDGIDIKNPGTTSAGVNKAHDQDMTKESNSQNPESTVPGAFRVAGPDYNEGLDVDELTHDEVLHQEGHEHTYEPSTDNILHNVVSAELVNTEREEQLACSRPDQSGPREGASKCRYCASHLK